MNQVPNIPPPAPSNAVKLTNWAKEPDITVFTGDLEAARPSHDARIRKVNEWNDLLDVKGAARPKKVPGRSSVQPKLIRRQAEWRYAALTEPFLSSEKLFKVKPRTWEDKDASEQNELVLNYQFREQMNLVQFIDDYVRADVDEGSAIARIGWERITKRVIEELPQFEHYPIVEQEDMDALQQAIQLKTDNPRGYNEGMSDEIKAAVDFFEENQVPTKAVIVGMVPTPVEKVIKNQPTVTILNPANVIFDPSCGGDLNKAMFVVMSFETSKTELLREKRYKNLDAVNWEDASLVTNPDHKTNTPTDFQFKDAARKKVVAYEYWGYYDIEGKGELAAIVATWVGNTLIRLERNPFPHQKPPFVLARYSPVKRELFGTPDAEILSDAQAISGAMYRGMIDSFGRSAVAQTGFAKGMLDPLNRRKFDEGRDYEYNPTGAHPSQSIHQHQFPEIPQSALTMLQLQDQQAEGLTGVKAFSGGMSGNAYGDVAAGIRGMLDAASKREMSILRRLAQGISEIGSMVISMNSVWLSEKEVVRLTNSEFITVNREDLVGNFDLKVDIATAEVDNAQAQDLAFMLQTMGPTMDFDITKMILSEIAQLKRMPTLAHSIKTFQKQPSPQEQRMAELEIEKAEAEVQKLRSEIAFNEARARQALAQAGNVDQKTLDEISGTTHARNMEQQQAQSRGNQNLQITKALTQPTKEGDKAPDIAAAVGYNQLSDTLNGDGIASPTSAQERDSMSQQDPRFSLGSSKFDPAMDPSLNPSINL